MSSTKKSLAETHPEVAKQWHPTIKNGELDTHKILVLAIQRKKVWWKCDKGDDHEWRSYIVSIG